MRKLPTIMDGQIRHKIRGQKQDDILTNFNEELIGKNYNIMNNVGVLKKCKIKDDEDVIITGYLKFKEERIFNPVSKSWQLLKCKQLHLQFGNIFKYIGKKKVLGEPTATKHIIGDGNCLFRSICYWLTGNEDDHLIVRKLISEVIILFNNLKLYLVLYIFMLYCYH